MPGTDQLHAIAVNGIKQSIGLCTRKAEYGVNAMSSQTRDKRISTCADSHVTRLMGERVAYCQRAYFNQKNRLVIFRGLRPEAAASATQLSNLLPEVRPANGGCEAELSGISPDEIAETSHGVLRPFVH